MAPNGDLMLKALYDTKDEIPAEFLSLYSEKGGKWELTGVSGVKTDADVARVQTALQKERADHKATKDRLGEWGDLKHDEVVAKLDRIAELEAAAGGALDKAKIDEIVQKRVDATLKTHTAPLERQITKLTQERSAFETQVKTLGADLQRRSLHDTLRPVLTEFKVLPEHHEDVFMYAERLLAPAEDGKFVTKDGVGVTPGLDPKAWLEEFLPKKPGWLPGSKGGGAIGGTLGSGAKNPWSHEGWNMTEQAAYFRQHGREKAEAAAKAVGTSLGGARPVKSK